MTAAPIRDRSALLAAGGLLVAVNVAARYGPAHAMLVLGPASAAALIALARRAGLPYRDMGLSRDRLRPGAVGAAVSVAAIVAVYAVALAVPATRDAFRDPRYQVPGAAAALTAFVAIPLGTVLPEEVAFRGVLWGLIARRRGPLVATAVSSALFGLWHVLPSLRLRVNPAVAAVVGGGRFAVVAAVAGAVVVTGLAGVVLCELRRRTGSLLAPAGAHWAANGLGALVAAALAATAAGR